MTTPSMRRTIVQIHLWLGLTIGLLWALQGLTGGVLVFYRELNRIGIPTTHPGPMASIEDILANAANVAGDAPIVRLSVADRQRDVVHAYYADSRDEARLRIVAIDAATAQPVGAGENDPKTPFSGSAPRWIFLLHMTLLSGAAGETLIGVTGLLLLSATIAGLWIAWPPRRGWKAAFSFHRWTRPQQKLYGWHRALGLMSGFLLLLIAVTGAYMSFDHWIDPAIGRIAHGMPHAMPMETQPAVTISPQHALDTALTRFPAAQWVRIHLPTREAPLYRVQMYQPGESRAWLGNTSVYIDPAHGHIVNIYDALDASVINRVLDAAYPLHNGEIVGWPGRIIVLLAGLTLPGMLITGVMSWLGKRKRRAAARQQAPAPYVSSGLPSTHSPIVTQDRLSDEG